MKGNMLTEDSWCGLENDYQTKPVGKNQILTFFSVRLLSSLTICSLQFQFISTVLIKALNRNKTSVSLCKHNYKYKHKLLASAMENNTQRYSTLVTHGSVSLACCATLLTT